MTFTQDVKAYVENITGNRDKPCFDLCVESEINERYAALQAELTYWKLRALEFESELRLKDIHSLLS